MNKTTIPSKYWKADEQHPMAKTVGELRQLLDELPDDLPLDAATSDGLSLIVYNINHSPSLGFSDYYTNDEDDDYVDIEFENDGNHLRRDDEIEDGFGSAWSAYCPMCNEKSMYVVRPGEAQCGNCD